MVRLKSRIRAHHLEERKAVSDLPLPRRPTDESTVRGWGASTDYRKFGPSPLFGYWTLVQ